MKYIKFIEVKKYFNFSKNNTWESPKCTYSDSGGLTLTLDFANQRHGGVIVKFNR
jgi:hypothetical protein